MFTPGDTAALDPDAQKARETARNREKALDHAVSLANTSTQWAHSRGPKGFTAEEIVTYATTLAAFLDGPQKPQAEPLEEPPF
jgi:hypothetical protein